MKSTSAIKAPSKLSMKPLSGFRPPSFRKLSPEEQNVFWHSAMTSEPPLNFTPGTLIPLDNLYNRLRIYFCTGLVTVLKKALNRWHDKGNTQRAWLCMETAVYIQGEQWDRSWGCGQVNSWTCIVTSLSFFEQLSQLSHGLCGSHESAAATTLLSIARRPQPTRRPQPSNPH